MKTKEDILVPYYKQNKNGLEEWIDYSDALIAMDEYARQQGIAYAHFLFRKLYPIMMVPTNPPMEESEILYSQFIETQQNNGAKD